MSESEPGMKVPKVIPWWAGRHIQRAVGWVEAHPDDAGVYAIAAVLVLLAWGLLIWADR